MSSFLKFLEETCPGDDAHDGCAEPNKPLLERCGMCRSIYEAHLKEIEELAVAKKSKAKIPCIFEITFIGFLFPCHLEFAHRGKCEYDLAGGAATLTWMPSTEDRVAGMAEIAAEAKRKS